MRGFDDVVLRWEGSEYTVPAHRVFDLVRIVEDVIIGDGTTPAAVLLAQQRVPYSRLADAYARAIQYAGAKVSPTDVYLRMMEGFAAEVAGEMVEGETAEFVAQACLGLLGIIAPPLALQAVEAKTARGR